MAERAEGFFGRSTILMAVLKVIDRGGWCLRGCYTDGSSLCK